MHPLNRLLPRVGVRILVDARFPKGLDRAEYERDLSVLQHDGRGFKLLREPVLESGDHPDTFIDFQCEFAAAQIAAHRPKELLDIGSYRQFVTGLAATRAVSTIDVRPRIPTTANERVIVADAKALPLQSNLVDCVVSLCALEHFGLGRYGDPFDPEADRSALREIIRVLTPGGRFVLGTTVTRDRPTIAFNAHRIYDRDMIRGLLDGLAVEAEAYFSPTRGPCEWQEVTTDPGVWNVYCGCWRKPD